jgi:predicted permease
MTPPRFLSTVREWMARLDGAVRRRRDDRDLEEELRIHLELATEDERRRAGPEGLANRDAAIRVGGMAQAMEAMRDQRGLPWLADVLADVRYAVRTLRRTPSFTIVAVTTLAVGIGATTAIYSVVDRILLQPLPFQDADRLVRIVENVPSPTPGRAPSQRGFSVPEFLQWRARSTMLSDAFAVSPGETVVRTNEGRARLWGGAVSSNTFQMLGTHAMLGRTLDRGDEVNSNVVVLGFDAWRRLFHSDPAAVGAVLEFRADFNASASPELVRARPMTVVGVMPADFELPTGPMDYYVPIAFGASERPSRVTVIGRVRPGVAMTAAVDEANVVGSALRPPLSVSGTALNVRRFEMQSVKDRLVGDWRPTFRVLLAAVGVVLLIVCANVANLLLARGTARRREMAVRSAIGASPGRLARQVLTECLVLACAGGALGALVGAGGVSLVKRLTSVNAPGIFRLGFGTTILPRGHEVGVDLRMFAISFGIAAITTLLFGLLPALHASRTRSIQAMGSRGGGSGRTESRALATLVVGQIGLATILLVCAGLLIQSFLKLSTVNRGYDPTNVLAFQLVLPPEYPIGRKVDSINALLTRVRTMPEVQAAGFTRAGILIGEALTIGTFVPPGGTVDASGTDPMRPLTRAVSAGYLTAVGAQFLAGRDFDASDTSTSKPVIVVSRAVARRYFGSEGAVGQLVDWHSAKGFVMPMQLIGVVEDVRNTTPDRAGNPEIFVEYQQLLRFQQLWGDSPQRQEQLAIGFLSFAVRTRGAPVAAAPEIARVVHSVDTNAGIDAMIPMDRLVASSVARPRFYAILLGVFAGVAGLLAAIGIYGVLAYALIQRTREIGIRLALGARRASVLGLMLRKGLILTTIGVTLGVGCAAGATRFLQGMLFGIRPFDPTTFAAVALMFGLVATLASYAPARRSTRVDPIIALRGDG